MGSRISPFAGMRVHVTGGPRAGSTGTVECATSGRQYRVRLDCGTLARVVRSAVVMLAPPPERQPKRDRGRYGDVVERVARLFELHPQLERVVVYRHWDGRCFVSEYRDRDYGPGLVGVYTREFDPAAITQDMTA